MEKKVEEYVEICPYCGKERKIEIVETREKLWNDGIYITGTVHYSRCKKCKKTFYDSVSVKYIDDDLSKIYYETKSISDNKNKYEFEVLEKRYCGYEFNVGSTGVGEGKPAIPAYKVLVSQKGYNSKIYYVVFFKQLATNLKICKIHRDRMKKWVTFNTDEELKRVIIRDYNRKKIRKLNF